MRRVQIVRPFLCSGCEIEESWDDDDPERTVELVRMRSKCARHGTLDDAAARKAIREESDHMNALVAAIDETVGVRQGPDDDAPERVSVEELYAGLRITASGTLNVSLAIPEVHKRKVRELLSGRMVVR